MSGVWLEGYALARESLIDALAALKTLSGAGFILVGAQAVYLRSEHIHLPIAPFTLDGDIVVDPRKVPTARAIAASLNVAGFTLRGHHGLYHRATESEERRRATEIDVFVPERFEADWDLQNYHPHDASAVMSQPGLELSLVDHSPMELHHADSGTSAVTVEVAGIVALMIAKAWKLGERHQQGQDRFAEVGKDVADIFRLLSASDPAEVALTLSMVPNERRYKDVALKGSTFLRALLTGEGAGIALFKNILGEGPDARRMLDSLPPLVDEFCGLVEEHL